MAKKDRESILMYKAWRHEVGETEDDGIEYGAFDVASAAKLWASYGHSHRDGWEWHWPIVVRVRDPEGKVWDVEVERIPVPEFEPGKPKPIS